MSKKPKHINRRMKVIVWHGDAKMESDMRFSDDARIDAMVRFLFGVGLDAERESLRNQFFASVAKDVTATGAMLDSDCRIHAS